MKLEFEISLVTTSRESCFYRAQDLALGLEVVHAWVAEAWLANFAGYVALKIAEIDIASADPVNALIIFTATRRIEIETKSSKLACFIKPLSLDEQKEFFNAFYWRFDVFRKKHQQKDKAYIL